MPVKRSNRYISMIMPGNYSRPLPLFITASIKAEALNVTLGAIHMAKVTIATDKRAIKTLLIRNPIPFLNIFHTAIDLCNII